MKSVLDKEEETSKRQIDSEALEQRLSSLSPLKNMLKPHSSLAARVCFSTFFTQNAPERQRIHIMKKRQKSQGNKKRDEGSSSTGNIREN